MRLQPISFLSPVPYLVCFILLAGGVAGNVIGEKLQRSHLRADANTYSQLLIAHAERILSSARITIDAANQSKFASCSPNDLIYLRELIFAAYHIKDIGRLEDDRLVCSTLLTDLSKEKQRS